MSSLKGASDLAKAFEKMSLKIQQEVKEAVAFHTSEVELNATRNAPGPGDPIKTEFGTESQERIRRNRSWTPINQGISSYESPDGYTGTIIVEKSVGLIGVWIEMGTGQSAKVYLATVPQEWRALAQLYYINGQGTIIAQPYFLPAFLKQQIDFIKDLKKILKNAKL